MSSIAQRISAVASRVNADAERKSWHRAIAAKALAIPGQGDAGKIVKAAWPDDARALAITKGGVTQTTSAGLWTYDPVTAYRSLAPAAQPSHSFQWA